MIRPGLLYLVLAAAWAAIAAVFAFNAPVCAASPAAASPADASPAGASPVKIAASIHPISALVREVGGPEVEVSTIIPPGADPHHFELTPSKARALHEARVILLIGGHFDEWILPHGEKPGGRDESLYMVVRFHEAFTDSLIHLEDSFNPHFWLDPMCAREMTRIIAVALCTVDFGNCEEYRARAAELIASLGEFRAAGRYRLAASGFEAYVALHPAWTYFARRFGIREAATLETSHEAEPSARHIAEVISLMASEGIGYIVADEFSVTDLARSVAAEVGATVILLDPIGSDAGPSISSGPASDSGPGGETHTEVETPAGRDTYLGLMEHNLAAIESSARKD